MAAEISNEELQQLVDFHRRNQVETSETEYDGRYENRNSLTL